ncbi:energy-coupled thiamine transporter ThiT [Geosporobacter ferrireducens]|uniref:Energy-coupled thiamine transporter ThiT n=1 Tax=Geosporobacter ferrireducens TaxID=1424294 RepID=A0A1D8GHC6_9FIRM|nr:energy-coupled thiamine transporter ThiT [Geosporobacter ferrireducens]AOT70318.1 energy-coupled thiamine transporter ThiT [Geosporobacter ferrireducens]MTI54286.1 energy-coupled thiamine transporter ThiT [Geosporobacter ferrireducens]
MKKLSTKMLVEAGIMIALAQILSYVKIFEAPYGGSVTAGSMVPILLFAIRWGVGPGLLAGTVYGLLQFILGPKYSFHILSILLDYLVAFGLLGLAGLFRKDLKGVYAGTFLGVFGRFVSSVLSGVIIWASYAPEGMNPWIYSIIYNGAYLLPELGISFILVGILYKAFKSIPK